MTGSALDSLPRLGWIDASWLPPLVLASVIVFALGLVLMPLFVAKIPSGYFMGEHPPLERLGQRSRAARAAVLVLKNALGAVLVLAGALMLVLPGQGILTLLAGLTLLDFPGKRRLELWLVRRGPVLRAVAWIRKRAGSPPLQLPPE